MGTPCSQRRKKEVFERVKSTESCHSQDPSQTLAFPFTQSPHLLKQWSDLDFSWGNVYWPSLDCGRTKSISLSRCDLSNDKVFTVKTLLNYILTSFLATKWGVRIKSFPLLFFPYSCFFKCSATIPSKSHPLPGRGWGGVFEIISANSLINCFSLQTTESRCMIQDGEFSMPWTSNEVAGACGMRGWSCPRSPAGPWDWPPTEGLRLCTGRIQEQTTEK